MMAEDPATFTATRDELIDALTRLDVRVLTSGPAAGKVCAESMADALIEALTGKRAPVHYRWPVACDGFYPGQLWTGNLDRVTCEACLLTAKDGDH